VFFVTMRRDPHDNVMTVAGELDVTSAPKLADALRRLEHSQHKDLSLDCAGICFCDCAGLSVLITAARRRRAAGGWLRLVNPSTALRRISGLAGVEPDPRHQPDRDSGEQQPVATARRSHVTRGRPIDRSVPVSGSEGVVAVSRCAVFRRTVMA
jgi:anti-anti-sigma factor